MRVSRRGKASRLTPTPGGDGRDTKVHHLVPDLADPADGRVAFRGRCPRLRAATGAGATAAGRDQRLLYGGAAAVAAALGLTVLAIRRRDQAREHHTS